MFTGFEIQNNQVLWASLVAQMVKNLPAMQETQVRSIQNKPKRFIKKKKRVSLLPTLLHLPPKFPLHKVIYFVCSPSEN